MIDDITLSLQITIITLNSLKESILELQRSNAEMKTLIDSIALIQKGDNSN